MCRTRIRSAISSVVLAALSFAASGCFLFFEFEEETIHRTGLKELLVYAGDVELPAEKNGLTFSVNAYSPDTSASLRPSAEDDNEILMRVDGGAWMAFNSDPVDLPFGETTIGLRCRNIETEAVRDYTVAILRVNKLPPVVFSPYFDGVFSGDTATIFNRVAGATIRYTVGDGSQAAPTESSGILGSSYEITSPVTIVARAFIEGTPPSDAVAMGYRVIVPPVLVAVPGGTFNNSVADMTVSPFSLGKYEVTWEQWRCVKYWAEANGYGIYDFATNIHIGNGDGLPGEPDEPVISLDWHSAVIWCNAASARFGRRAVYYQDAAFTKPIVDNSRYWSGEPQGSVENPYVDWTADGYRLPTEAEWECAARYRDGVSWTPASFASGATADYTDAAATGAVAWYDENSDGQKHPVGEKQPNALGIYDMSGNALEHCWDCYGPYPTSAKTDYRGPVYGSAGTDRMARGGGWLYDGLRISCGRRFFGSPGLGTWAEGFRVAVSAP